MSDTVKYIVKRPFKYGGEQLQSGDEWQPAGGKWVDQIRENDNLVSKEIVSAKKRQRKVKNGEE